MKLINRFIPWLLPLALYVSLQRLIDQPEQIYIVSAFGLALIMLSVWQLAGRDITSEKFWRFVITPVFFMTAALFFLAFLKGSFGKQVYLIIIVLFLGVYLEVLYLWFHARPKYQAHSLDNISSHLNLLTVFLTSVGFYSLISFIGFPWWMLTIAFGVMTILLTYELVWTTNSSLRSAWIFVAVISLITTEIFLVITYLPSSAYVNASLVTLAYYNMTGLARNWLLEIKERRILKRYVIISAITFFIILATAKWF